MSQDNSTTVRYSDADLAEFKALIEKKVSYAKSDLKFYLDSLKEMSDNPDNKVKGLDDGTASAEVTRLNTLASRQQKHRIQQCSTHTKRRWRPTDMGRVDRINEGIELCRPNHSSGVLDKVV